MNDTIQLSRLNQKIDFLQSKIDSIGQNVTLKQLQYELNDKQDVITQINDFYDSAWLKLIIIISILGILIPFIAQYFQRKNLRELTSFIQEQMNDNFEIKLRELKSFNKLEIEKTLFDFKESVNDLKQKNETLNSQIEGSLFFLQGQQTYKNKKYIEAVKDFIFAGYHWLNTDRTSRIELTFGNIVTILKQVKKADDLNTLNEQLIPAIKMNFYEFIDYCENHSYNNVIENHLKDINKEIERIKNVV